MKLPDILYKILRKMGIASKPSICEFPKEVDIGLTNACNLNCSFCLNSKIKKKRGFMEEGLYRSLVDCMADKFKSKTIIGIGLFGEDTMHPNFVDFLKYASSHGLKINISTNFLNIDQTISQAIIDSEPNLIEVSFYTLDREEYNKTTGRDKYDQVLKNIHSFMVMAEKAGFKGKIRLRPFQDFTGQADAYKKEFYQKYPNLNFENQKPKTKHNWAGSLNVPKLLRGIYTLTPCSFPFSRLAVDWDGEVRLCCVAMLAQDLTVGHVSKDHDLYDLWNGEKLNEVREKFSKIDYKDFPTCRNCYFARRYFPLRKD